MNTRTCVICSLFLICLCFAVPAGAQQVVERDVCRMSVSGDEARGPALIKLKNVNIVKYNVQVNQTVTFSAGPDLTLPFIPPIPQAQAQQAAAPARDGGQSEDQFNQLLQAIESKDFAGIRRFSPGDILAAIVILLNRYETDRVSRIQIPINQAIQSAESATNRTRTFVNDSDARLCNVGAKAVIAGIIDVIKDIDVAVNPNTSWPFADIADLQGKLNVLNNVLITQIPTPTPQQAPVVAFVKARIAELQTWLTSVGSGSETARQYQEARTKLIGWRDHLFAIQARDESAFTLPEFEVGCNFAFDRNKRTKVEIVMQDRLAAPGTAASTREIITIVCSSPLSVSAGFGFSMNDEREFAFVQSTKTVTDDMGQTSDVVIKRFGFTNRSSFRTLPVLLLNTRLYEPNDRFAFHASVGAAVDINSGETGTDVEFIIGPSISFWRSLFITGGLHFGREPKLVGGFEIGDEVPEGVSSPPIEKAWKRGAAITFTYKIR